MLSTYTSLVQSGILWDAVRLITEKYWYVLYQPRYTCSKIGETLIEVLQSKHPDVRLALNDIFDSYMGTPKELIPLDIMKNTVTEVGHWISEGVGPGGKDRINIQHWIFTTGRSELNSGRLLVI